ncbi:hypothetical protein KIN20_024100 [Parelaphostrongylus tenuis]|uniref:Uncharacterized protein n=1 Tax=Parelaphostrongylus tenuis TaxID=148309 RepID=A0AAD5QTD9_PARTN|nr:hypothetical protein KIN20_024098 [Parelaphostrongylus tenuis]KAJ1364093.1 hypothetical protein KIN20_024100 [Parelaphostrongylus tenuis]
MEVSLEQIVAAHARMARSGNDNEAVCKISVACGDNTVAERVARKLLAKFKAGENSLKEQPRLGRSQEVLRSASLAFLPTRHLCMSSKRICFHDSPILKEL